MQSLKTFNMGWQEMARWKCCLSRVWFNDKGFSGKKFVGGYFLEIFNVSSDLWLKALVEFAIVLQAEMVSLGVVISSKWYSVFLQLKANYPLIQNRSSTFNNSHSLSFSLCKSSPAKQTSFPGVSRQKGPLRNHFNQIFRAKGLLFILM